MKSTYIYAAAYDQTVRVWLSDSLDSFPMPQQTPN